MALIPSNNLTAQEKRAERDARQQEALLREVDDAVREDQFAYAVQRYGKQAGALVALALLLFAAWLWWSNHRETRLERNSEELVKSLDQLDAGYFDTADKALAPLADGGAKGTSTVAKLTRAGIAAQQGKTDAAAKLYAEIADDGSTPGPYRDLATLRGVALSYDKLKPEEVVKRLKPLAQPGKPYFGSAGELLGAAYLDQGRKDLAGPLFASISRDKNVPQSLRSRARQMAGMLGVDAVDDVDKTLAEIRTQDAAQPAAQPQPQSAPK
ncbi:MAG TPA: tetratricopeptide repeat protein [Sphingomonadaceae bacterium]